MINIDLNATYDGMTPSEVLKEFIKPMQEMGMSDQMIQEILDSRKNVAIGKWDKELNEKNSSKVKLMEVQNDNK